MFCVIQEIELKKPNKYGYPKRLEAKYMEMTFQGQDCGHYYYTYSLERFERPIKKAYKISIHENYREGGKLKKKQFVLCTAGYYDLAGDFFSVYEYCDHKILNAAAELGVDSNIIYDLVDKKITPLIEQIREEFSQTEEFMTHEEHEKITTLYAIQKTQFGSDYDVDSGEYDKCYDVFGTLQNPDYLQKIKYDYAARRKYEKKSRSYQENFYSNYSKYSSGSSGYSNLFSSNYSESDKEILKQFYRILSKKYHPDVNHDKDTSEEMKLINQLKKEWGV